MKTMKAISNTLLISAILILVSSCIHEEWDSAITGKSGEAKVILRLKTPGGFSAAQSRGLTNADENRISDIYVLVFDSQNKLTAIEKGVNVTHNNTPGGGSGSEFSGSGSFSVTLAPSKTNLDTYNLVVLANAGGILQAMIGFDADDNSLIHDRSYSAVTAAIGESIAGRMYPSGGTVPMWGESSAMLVQPGNNSSTVRLTRSVARIDVGVGKASNAVSGDRTDFTWDGEDSSNGTIPFVLTEVYVISPNNRYAVVPDNTLPAGTPTVPFGTGAFTLAQSESAFNFTATASPTGGYSKRDIYVPEADILMESSRKPSGKLGDADHERRMALVVGGEYNGSANTTYYRLDFAAGGSLMNVLRNHLYLFNISKVSGEGHPDVETAYKSLAMNMTAEVEEWDEADMGEIKFDGQNYLAVSPTEIELFRNPSTSNAFTVKTDVSPSGWQVTGVTDSPDGKGTPVTWIKNVTPMSGAGDEAKHAVTFEVEENAAVTDRTAWIHVKAGRLDFPVKVTQRVTEQVAIYTKVGGYDVSEIFFSSLDLAGSIKTLDVSWLPKDASLDVSVSQVGAISGFTGANTPSTGTVIDPAGTKSYAIGLPVIPAGAITGNPFYEQISKVDFMTRNTVGEFATGAVFVRYVNYALTTDASSDYMLMGKTYKFRVKSNAFWRIQSVTATDPGLLNMQPADNLKQGTSGGPDTTSGTEISFTTIYSTTPVSGKKVTVVFESTDIPKKFADRTVEFTLSSAVFPAYPNVIGIDGDGRLNVAGNGALMLFKFGSVVGFTQSTSNNDAWRNDYIRFNPMTDQSAITGYGYNSTSLPGIPGYVNGDGVVGQDGYVSSIAYHNAANIRVGKGDPCQLIGLTADEVRNMTGVELDAYDSGWRLPTNAENATFVGHAGSQMRNTHWDASGSKDPLGGGRPGGVFPTLAAGTSDFYLPATGSRSKDHGNSYHIGGYGYYWSSTVYNTTDGYFLRFDAGKVSPMAYNYFAYSFSVRCVRK